MQKQPLHDWALGAADNRKVCPHRILGEWVSPGFIWAIFVQLAAKYINWHFMFPVTILGRWYCWRSIGSIFSHLPVPITWGIPSCLFLIHRQFFPLITCVQVPSFCNWVSLGAGARWLAFKLTQVYIKTIFVNFGESGQWGGGKVTPGWSKKLNVKI